MLPVPNGFDFANFGKQFLTAYFALGFGTLSKKEIELLVFKLLHDADALPVSVGAGNRLQQTSVKLKIPVARVRALTYEMQLRAGIVSAAWFREKLLDAIRTTRFKRISEHNEYIEFGVEDPMLRAEIEGRLKQEGRFPDYGMAREILHLGLDDFAFLIENFVGFNR